MISKIKLPVIIALQTALLVSVLVLSLKFQSEQMAKMQTQISCDFFVQIKEWQSGHEEEVSPDFSSQNEQGALRTYNRVITEESSLCQEGLCLDSARVSLFKSCPDETSVETLRDTMIYF